MTTYYKTLVDGQSCHGGSLEELDALRIWSSGEHEIDKLPCVVSGSATVGAWGSATVEAWGSATVEASGSATVRAEADVTVISWRGCKAVKVTERAVWVDRTGDTPRVVMAETPASGEETT